MGEERRRRRWMDRFIGIRFFSTCRSCSSVDDVAGLGKKPQGAGGEPAAGRPKGESLLARLRRGFKNLSQIFAVFEEEEEEEEEKEMVIGLPTDVKHVAHIGWDGSTSTTASVHSWNRAAPPPPSPSTSSSTAAAAAAAPPPSASISSYTTTTDAAAAAPPADTQSPAPAPPPPPPASTLSTQQLQLAMAAQAAADASSSSAAATTAS